MEELPAGEKWESVVVTDRQLAELTAAQRDAFRARVQLAARSAGFDDIEVEYDVLTMTHKVTPIKRG